MISHKVAKFEVCRACSNTKGCESRESRNDRNLKAESKGVYREAESEGS